MLRVEKCMTNRWPRSVLAIGKIVCLTQAQQRVSLGGRRAASISSVDQHIGNGTTLVLSLFDDNLLRIGADRHHVSLNQNQVLSMEVGVAQKKFWRVYRSQPIIAITPFDF